MDVVTQNRNIRSHKNYRRGAARFSNFSQDIKRAQEYLNSYERRPEVFQQLIAPTLQKLEVVSKKQKNVNIDELRSLVIDMKSNGAMFGYESVTRIASPVLCVLQEEGKLNQDMVDVCCNLYMAVQYIIKHNVFDERNVVADNLFIALDGACRRYRNKYSH